MKQNCTAVCVKEILCPVANADNNVDDDDANGVLSVICLPFSARTSEL